MGGSNGFTFKRFYVQHDRCAMKVGTDGVLLGCWCNVRANGRCLDIGTGSGLIALMIAQRSGMTIDAIDMDSSAIEQCAENFEQSPWADRLRAYASSLQDWSDETGYDLIVSNPPFFQNSLKNPDKGREQARHTDSLSYTDLVSHSVRLLRDGGEFAIILPAESEVEFCQLAKEIGLSLVRVTRVYSKETKPVRRVMLSWCKGAYTQPLCEDILVLEDGHGQRSKAYQELAKDFYL